MEESSSFSDILRDELLRRKRNNSSYSLRSFARSLGLSSSFLSKLMNGKRSVSETTLLKLATRIGLSEEQLEVLSSQMVQKTNSPEFEAICADQFKLIADWHHYAILECASLFDFESSPTWIANRLSISEERARLALERLTRLGFLKLDKNGKLVAVLKDYSSVTKAGISSANTEHQRQILEGAIAALDVVPTKRRHQGSVTLAIPESRLPEAIDRIRKFRRELMSFLQRKGRRDAVYQLSISFYPLTQNKK
jgi:uncharacterized protein (TIGR02147 family)